MGIFLNITNSVGIENMCLIIIAITLILFLLDRIPISMTALLSSLALAMFGCMEFEQVYAGFSSSLVMLVFGMLIIGDALFETGVVILVGKSIMSTRFAQDEKKMMILISLVTALLSAFLSNTAVVATFIPLIGAMVASSNGKLRNKFILMPMGIATCIGGTLTLVGSTSQPMANSILLDNGYEGLGMFDFAYVMLPCLLITLLYLGTIGYKLMEKYFTFEDLSQDVDLSHIESFKPNSKTYIAAGSLVFCIIGFVSDFLPMAIVSLIGASIVILTGCVDFKTTLKRMDWNTLLLMAFAQGIASGMNDSGAGKMLAESTVKLFGDNMTLIFITSIIIGVILTNIMSNTATAAMMTPIYITVATSLGFNPYALAMGIGISTNLCTATPIGGTAMSQTLVAGYSFKDYLILGLPLTILLTVVVSVLCPIFYGFTPL